MLRLLWHESCSPFMNLAAGANLTYFFNQLRLISETLLKYFVPAIARTDCHVTSDDTSSISHKNLTNSGNFARELQNFSRDLGHLPKM